MILMDMKREMNFYVFLVMHWSRFLEKFRSEQLDVDTLAQEVKRATELIAACKSRLKEVEGEVNKILEAGFFLLAVFLGYCEQFVG